tara:strand:- start:48 stop:224 length:177 start_codon:yes stop_codon:yes gene_type:complete
MLSKGLIGNAKYFDDEADKIQKEPSYDMDMVINFRINRNSDLKDAHYHAVTWSTLCKD